MGVDVWQVMLKPIMGCFGHDLGHWHGLAIIAHGSSVSQYETHGLNDVPPSEATVDLTGHKEAFVDVVMKDTAERFLVSLSQPN